MEPIEIKGLDKLNRLVAAAGDNAIQALAEGLYWEATMAFNESQTLVPVDTGILRASGHMNPVDKTENSVEVTISYGGPASSYALFVHERIYAPSGKKVYHAPPTRAKYLETPAKRRVKGMAQRLGVYLQRRIGQGY